MRLQALQTSHATIGRYTAADRVAFAVGSTGDIFMATVNGSSTRKFHKSHQQLLLQLSPHRLVHFLSQRTPWQLPVMDSSKSARLVQQHLKHW
jgi:ectoine hydroxylase-related dioxygenase (phytanoyl-CoA dioxygenase family)